MKLALFLATLVVLVLAPAAAAQWADPVGSSPYSPAKKAVSYVAVAPAPSVAVTVVQESAPETVAVSSGRAPCNPYAEACEGYPGSPYPAPSRSKVCNPFRGCGVTTPIPTPERPPVPSLVTSFSALLSITNSCFIEFKATLAGGTSNNFITFGRRDYLSSGPFVTTYGAYTVNGVASILVPAKGTGGEWQAAWQSDVSTVVTVSNALPIICG